MKKLRNVIDSIFDDGYDRIVGIAHFREIENWDSLQYVRLVVALQVEFGIELDPEEIQKITSITAIEAVLKSKGVEL